MSDLEFNFTNILRAAFFVQIFRQSQKKAQKSTKKRAKNVDEVNTWSQFHQHITSSFCANIIEKLQKNTFSTNKVSFKMVLISPRSARGFFL